MNKDLLWEIGVEEVPARFLPAVIKQMTSLAEESFHGAGLRYDLLKVYATPRRLTLSIQGLADKAADTETEMKGPAVKAAYDEKGEPTKALQGFCRGQGLDAADLKQKEINGNFYIYAVKKKEGCQTAALLPELLLPMLDKLYFPKPMRWGYNTRRFVRPVRWMVALFGQEIIDIEFAGVKADRYTRGHRLLGSGHIELAQPADYLDALRENYVICDQKERGALCWQQIQQVATEIGGKVEADEELLEEVTFLLEYPTALAGHFEEKYLAIPKELIITPMREHQRYFPVYGPDGKLLPRFITVRNGDSRYLSTVAEGNEKVLRARLADAEFFYNEDLKEKMDDKVEQLSAVVFHEKIGTMRQKVGRIVKLSEEIARQLQYSEAELAQTRRAAYLAKADLGSRVVFEFPELQGIIGEYYAHAAGEDPVVAQSIREHYLPRFAGDELPESKPGIAVALADKLDSLCAFFAIGMIPSGSQDPYALRRAAMGCAQIILRHQLDLRLRELLPVAFDLIEADAPAVAKEKKISGRDRLESAILFMHQRLENIMSEQGISYDVINAVNRVGLAKADLAGVLHRANMIQSYRQNPRFDALLAGFTRAANILRSAAEKKKEQALTVTPALLVDPCEEALYGQVLRVKEKIQPLLEAGAYQKVFDEVSELTPFIDTFFDTVMVMDKEEAIRKNRIALLLEIVDLTADVGDLSQIVAVSE